MQKSTWKPKPHQKIRFFSIFDLLYFSHHKIPTIENLVANTQLILQRLGIPYIKYWLYVLKPGETFKDFCRAKTAKKAKFVWENALLGRLGASKIFELGCNIIRKVAWSKNSFVAFVMGSDIGTPFLIFARPFLINNICLFFMPFFYSHMCTSPHIILRFTGT